MLAYLPRVPREGGDPDEGQPAVWSRNFWVPAFAGNTGFGDRLPLPMDPGLLRHRTSGVI